MGPGSAPGSSPLQTRGSLRPPSREAEVAPLSLHKSSLHCTSGHVPCRKLLQPLPCDTSVQRPASSEQTNLRADDHCASTVCVGVCVCPHTHTRGMRWILNLHLRHHLPTQNNENTATYLLSAPYRYFSHWVLYPFGGWF